MYITKDLARQIENAFKHRHIAMAGCYPEAKIRQVQDGIACFIDEDSFFTQAVGWGFEPLESLAGGIKIIEQFYCELCHPRIEVSLSSMAGNDPVQLLNERGYRVTELNTVLALDLRQYISAQQASKAGFSIRLLDSDKEGWASTVATGFNCEEAGRQFLLYAKSEGVAIFGAYYQGKLVAGGALAVHGNACDLGLMSTLPAYRGQGLQKQLLIARLDYAKQLGLQLATVVTEPASISELNAQKVGFQCAYTRMKFTKWRGNYSP